MNDAPTTPPPRRKRLLNRWRWLLISLPVVFVLALPLSYEIGRRVYRQQQLGKLEHTDAAVFEDGLTYVGGRAGEDPAVASAAYRAAREIAPERATQLLLTVAAVTADDPPLDEAFYSASADAIERMTVDQAVGFYDALVQVEGIDQVKAAKLLLAALQLGDDAALRRAAVLLEPRLLWSEAQVRPAWWLRWLAMLAQSPDELSQLQAARGLGDRPGDVGDRRVAEALQRLSESDHAAVRAEVLSAAAGYAAIADDPIDYEQIIFALGGDPDPTIARRAWMVVGHLNPLSGYAVKWQDADPFIAEAMLWAAVKTNPDRPEPALEALRDHNTSAIGMLALSETDVVQWDELYLPEERHEGVSYGHAIRRSSIETRSDAIAVWRSWLAIDPFRGDVEPWLVNLAEALDATPDPFMFPDDDIYEHVKQLETSYFLAATYRLNYPYTPGDRTLSQGERAAASLAAIEGRFLAPFPQDGIEYYEPEDFFPALIAAAYAKPTPDLSTLFESVRLDEPALLDLFTLALLQTDATELDRHTTASKLQVFMTAALASAMRGHRPTLIDGITADLLRNDPELTKQQLHAMPDAELTELGLKHVDALTALLDAAEAAPASAGRQQEAKLLRLALWMRGDLGDAYTPTAEAMLFDDDVPTSTVLMCLLHMRRPVALDYLFGDLVTPQPDLHDLFIGKRWWHVFRHFVDTSDMPLWLWGDPEAQQFQLEAMRQWYAVNRWLIAEGWWPESAKD